MRVRRIVSLFVVIFLTFQDVAHDAANSVVSAAPKDEGGKANQEGLSGLSEGDEDYYELLKLFVDALDQVERNYVQDLTRRELVEAAIQGMLSKLDQHTSYIAPAELDRFRSGVENQFGGIGIQIAIQREKLIIVSPLVGTPAYRAGLMADDEITHIEGESTKGLGLDEVIKRLKGKVGTEVELSVLHTEDEETETVKLTREMIRVETVLASQRKEDDTWDYLFDKENRIGYVRVTAFGRNTSRELRRVLRQLTDQEIQGLILDLRFNPGGLLTSAVEVADLFVAEGRIVSTSGRNVPEQKWDARRRGTFEEFPMAVLVNQFSASASEIVSACLQDHERAVVVGQRTFGKGSVQNIIEFDDGSAMKLTTAGYHRPSGKNIDRIDDADESSDWGVRPSDGFEVTLSRDEVRQLARRRHALDILKREDSEAEESDEFEDRQLNKALEYVKNQISPAEETAAAETPEPETPEPEMPEPEMPEPEMPEPEMPEPEMPEPEAASVDH